MLPSKSVSPRNTKSAPFAVIVSVNVPFVLRAVPACVPHSGVIVPAVRPDTVNVTCHVLPAARMPDCVRSALPACVPSQVAVPPEMVIAASPFAHIVSVAKSPLMTILRPRASAGLITRATLPDVSSNGRYAPPYLVSSDCR